jgi:hypothetical protein
MSRYVLCRYALGQRGEIEIPEKEYLSLAGNIRTLIEISDLEEKYNAFIDNYFELERGLLEEALRAMIYANFDPSGILDSKNTISRRIINLLTSIKLYLDSYPQHARRLLAGEALQDLKKAPSRAYDRSLSYRTIEALRNYAQHEAFPVHGWTMRQSWDNSTEPSLLRATVSPSLDLSTLAKASQFKKSVLQELRSSGGPVELKPLIRECIEELSIVHEEFRAATKSLMDGAKNGIQGAVNRFTAEYPGNEIGIVALPVDKDGIQVGDPVHLSASVIKYLPHQIARIGTMGKYSRRRVEY